MYMMVSISQKRQNDIVNTMHTNEKETDSRCTDAGGIRQQRTRPHPQPLPQREGSFSGSADDTAASRNDAVEFHR